MESGFRYEKFWGKIGSVNTDLENYTALVIISPLAVDCFFFWNLWRCILAVHNHVVFLAVPYKGLMYSVS